MIQTITKNGSTNIYYKYENNRNFYKDMVCMIATTCLALRKIKLKEDKTEMEADLFVSNLLTDVIKTYNKNKEDDDNEQLILE